MIEYTVLHGLALFGLTWLIRHTDGPFDLFLKLRKLTGIEYLGVYDNHGKQVNIVEEIPEKFFAKLLGCFWCQATWWSLILTIYSWQRHLIAPSMVVIVWLGAIGVAGSLYEMIEQG